MITSSLTIAVLVVLQSCSVVFATPIPESFEFNNLPGLDPNTPETLSSNANQTSQSLGKSQAVEDQIPPSSSTEEIVEPQLQPLTPPVSNTTQPIPEIAANTPATPQDAPQTPTNADTTTDASSEQQQQPVNTTVTTTADSSPPTEIKTSEETEEKHLSTKQKFGIAGGVAAAALLGGSALWWLNKKRKEKKQAEEGADEPAEEDETGNPNNFVEDETNQNSAEEDETSRRNGDETSQKPVQRRGIKLRRRVKIDRFRNQPLRHRRTDNSESEEHFQPKKSVTKRKKRQRHQREEDEDEKTREQQNQNTRVKDPASFENEGLPVRNFQSAYNKYKEGDKMGAVKDLLQAFAAFSTAKQ